LAHSKRPGKIGVPGGQQHKSKRELPKEMMASEPPGSK